MNRKLELTETLGNERDRATVIGNIGGVYFTKKQYGQAAGYDLKAIAISRRIGDICSEYYALYNLAKAREMMGQREKEMGYYRQDLEMARQLGDHPGEEDIIKDIRKLGIEPG